jgi:hypothetical protein
MRACNRARTAKRLRRNPPESLKALVASAQLRAQRVVNAAVIELYWKIGRTILERQQA